MTENDIIRMAIEAGEYADTHHEKHGGWLDAERHQFANLVAAAEQNRCIGIIYGQCGSDNVAQRTVDAIRSQS